MQRLQTRSQFQAVLAGAVVAKTAHFALHRNALDARPVQAETGGPAEVLAARPLFPVQDVWFGAMVPKRWAKRAVTRNAIKRQIYTVSQALPQPLSQAAHVVRLRSAFAREQFESATSAELKRAVRSELEQLFARAAA